MDSKQNLNEMITSCIGILALLGHGRNVSGLSQLRQENLKPAFKFENHSLCTATVEPASTLLFEDHLARQTRDKKKTNKSQVSSHAPHLHGATKQFNFKKNSSGHNQPVFRRCYRSTSGKKQTSVKRPKEEIMQLLGKN